MGGSRNSRGNGGPEGPQPLPLGIGAGRSCGWIGAVVANVWHSLCRRLFVLLMALKGLTSLAWRPRPPGTHIGGSGAVSVRASITDNHQRAPRQDSGPRWLCRTVTGLCNWASWKVMCCPFSVSSSAGDNVSSVLK